MKKALIIDDRKDRKKLYLSEEEQEALRELEKNGHLTIKESFPSETFLESFSLIAAHRSYLVNTGKYNELFKYCRQNQKFLIVFSGNISPNIIMNSGQQLDINASDFYSKNLPTFISGYCNNEYKYPLLQYLYGSSWRLSLLLQYRYLLWTYDNLDEIEDLNDRALEERLRSILWEGYSVSFEKVTNEINDEISKNIHS